MRTLSSSDSPSLSSSPRPQSPLTAMSPLVDAAMFRQSFFAPIHLTPITLSIKTNQAFASIFPIVPSLESEYLPFSTLHQIPKGVTAAAVHAAQLMRDIMDIAFALKIENGPTGPWRIPAMQHRHMSAVTEAVADTLDALQGVVSGKIAAVGDVLRCIKIVDERMTRQVAETVATAKAIASTIPTSTSPEPIISNFNPNTEPEQPIISVVPGSTQKQEGQEQLEVVSGPKEKIAPLGSNDSAAAVAAESVDAGGPLRMDVVMLVYLGMSVTQQLRILCRATVLAFLAGNQSAAEAMDTILVEQPEFGHHQGAESLMARVLESNYWSEHDASSLSSAELSTGIEPLLEVRVHSPKVEVLNAKEPLRVHSSRSNGDSLPIVSVREEGEEGSSTAAV